ncbi:MAG: ATP-binding cassette domain-containing protein [Gammaproteobacteria bacterium]|nr:ATP-binding cassette domain-containing protein [Gammaproteobacteria bacterium]
MSLLNLEKLSISFGTAALLDQAELSIQSGERLCLLGRNGSGKSTLLKLISGQIQADDGTIRKQKHLRISMLGQDLPEANELSVYHFVAQGAGSCHQLLVDYHDCSANIDADSSTKDLEVLQKIQDKLDAEDAWQYEQRIATAINRLQLNADDLMSSLSGGRRRRAALAKALVSQPDLLLLDEPTNHLDLDSIKWLETNLPSIAKTLLFITHDRQFVDALATRIIELDRGQLKSYPGTFAEYYLRKQEQLEIEERENKLFDKKLAAEEVWIRQGIKARRTRNEGRVRDLKALRSQRADRREIRGNAKIKIEAASSSGKLVAELKSVSKGFDSKTIINNFSTRIIKGDRIGILGDNGSGKSTLLKLILGELSADSGEIYLGTNLDVAYFDQTREQIDPEKTVGDNIADGNDFISINGQQRHVISYLQDFLFSPDRIRTPAKALSGGEFSRLMLARLFSKPNNLLVLDEPTNDLDLATLELLEQQIADYKGTLLLVSHDRAFIDNTVTSLICLDGTGYVSEFVGGYTDWINYQTEYAKQKVAEQKQAANKASSKKQNKLSYKDQRELEQLPDIIAKLEERMSELQGLINSPNFFSGDTSETQPILDELSSSEKDIATLYSRWEELE